MTPDPERLERSLRAWMTDARPPLADRDARINDILAALDDQPRSRHGILARWRHRGRHKGSAGDRSLLNAFALVAVLAVVAVAVNSVQRLPTVPATPPGETFVVAADGSGDFLAINTAVEAAKDGDTVLVRPGSYRGPVDIDKDITLRGLGPAEQVHLAVTADAVAAANEELPFAIRLDASEATVADLAITGDSGSVGVVVRGGSPALEGLILGLEGGRRASDGWMAFLFLDGATPTVRGSQWHGYLAVREGSTPVIEDNQIFASIVSIDGPGATTLRGNRFFDGSSASISWLARGRIEGNQFDGGGGIGIDTESDVTVTGNTFRGSSTQPAIFLRDIGTRGRIEGNTIVDAHHGIVLGSGTAGTVVGNVLLDNGIAVNIEASQADVADNSIHGGRVGIFVAKGAAPTLSGNSIEEMDQQGIFISAGTRPTLRENELCGSWSNLVVIQGAQPILDGNEICEDEPAK